MAHPEPTFLNTSELFEAISVLDSKYNIRPEHLPVVTVIGPQSAGKSSVLESLCGVRILPKFMGMATKKPTHLTTIRSPIVQFTVGNRVCATESEAQEEIIRLNSNTSVTKIDIEIKGPSLYNCFLLDLPGLFYVTTSDSDMPKRVKQMTIEALSDPNVIPVVVHSAPTDLATNQALQLVQKYKRVDDSFGILTKMDMLEGQKSDYIVQTLRGEMFRLGYGYVAVSLANDEEVAMGITVEQKKIIEADFFERYPFYTPYGVDEMCKRMSYIQFEKIRHSIPVILSDIERIIQGLTQSSGFFESMVNGNNSQLAIQLKLLIEKLIGSSPERAGFEHQLKKQFSKEIGEYIESLIPKEELPKEPTFTVNRTPPLLVTYHRSTDPTTDPDLFKEDRFRDLFCFGTVSPVLIDNQTIQKAFNSEAMLGYSLPSIEFVGIDRLKDPIEITKIEWYKSIKHFFNNLLHDDKITNMVYDITEKMVLGYLYQDGIDDVTRIFAEYLVKEIGLQTYERDIKSTIRGIICTEKRPDISLFDISREIIAMYPDHFRYTGSFWENFSKDNRRLQVEVYGPIFNVAYLRTIYKRLSDNCYRNVAVNWIDNFVDLLIQKTVDMLSKQNAEKEKNKIDEKIADLKSLAEILVKFL